MTPARSSLASSVKEDPLQDILDHLLIPATRSVETDLTSIGTSATMEITLLVTVVMPTALLNLAGNVNMVLEIGMTGVGIGRTILPLSIPML